MAIMELENKVNLMSDVDGCLLNNKNGVLNKAILDFLAKNKDMISSFALITGRDITGISRTLDNEPNITSGILKANGLGSVKEEVKKVYGKEIVVCTAKDLLGDNPGDYYLYYGPTEKVILNGANRDTISKQVNLFKRGDLSWIKGEGLHDNANETAKRDRNFEEMASKDGFDMDIFDKGPQVKFYLKSLEASGADSVKIYIDDVPSKVKNVANENPEVIAVLVNVEMGEGYNEKALNTAIEIANEKDEEKSFKMKNNLIVEAETYEKLNNRFSRLKSLIIDIKDSMLDLVELAVKDGDWFKAVEECSNSLNKMLIKYENQEYDRVPRETRGNLLKKNYKEFKESLAFERALALSSKEQEQIEASLNLKAYNESNDRALVLKESDRALRGSGSPAGSWELTDEEFGFNVGLVGQVGSRDIRNEQTIIEEREKQIKNDHLAALALFKKENADALESQKRRIDGGLPANRALRGSGSPAGSQELTDEEFGFNVGLVGQVGSRDIRNEQNIIEEREKQIKNDHLAALALSKKENADALESQKRRIDGGSPAKAGQISEEEADELIKKLMKEHRMAGEKNGKIQLMRPVEVEETTTATSKTTSVPAQGARSGKLPSLVPQVKPTPTSEIKEEPRPQEHKVKVMAQEEITPVQHQPVPDSEIKAVPEATRVTPQQMLQVITFPKSPLEKIEEEPQAHKYSFLLTGPNNSEIIFDSNKMESQKQPFYKPLEVVNPSCLSFESIRSCFFNKTIKATKEEKARSEALSSEYRILAFINQLNDATHNALIKDLKEFAGVIQTNSESGYIQNPSINPQNKLKDIIGKNQEWQQTLNNSFKVNKKLLGNPDFIEDLRLVVRDGLGLRENNSENQDFQKLMTAINKISSTTQSDKTESIEIQELAKCAEIIKVMNDQNPDNKPLLEHAGKIANGYNDKGEKKVVSVSADIFQPGQAVTNAITDGFGLTAIRGEGRP
jgi:hypothetical protein